MRSVTVSALDPRPQVAAYLILASFLIVVSLSHLASRQSGRLGLRLEQCGDGVCVAWVMPVGHAWECGARPGMTVVSIDGRAVTGSPRSESFTELEAADRNGASVHIRVRPGTSSQRGVQLSLALLGGLFALLAAVVLVRRPDLPTARLFALFGGFTSIALAAGSAAGGTKPVWALIVMFLSVVGLAGSLPLFMLALVADRREMQARDWPVLSSTIAASLLVLAYLACVAFHPAAYRWVGLLVRVYLLAAVTVSLAIQLWGLRQSSRAPRQPVRWAMLGWTFGIVPSIVLTLVPEIFGFTTVVPAHVSVLFWGFVPLTLAYAILQHQLLGIRRLIHRGMVYAAASVALLIGVSLVAATFFSSTQVDAPSTGRLVLFVMLAAVLFRPLRFAAHWMFDRYLYEVVDSRDLIEVMRDDLVESDDLVRVPRVIVRRMAQALQLESALLAVGPTPTNATVEAVVGRRADEVVREAYPVVRKRIAGRQSTGLIQVMWKADVLVVAPLRVSGATVGFLYLGPREGDVFLDDELRFIATVTPILAMTLHEARLLDEVRDLNERLVNAEEAERARIAQDIHDGPLQKAILLGGVIGAPIADATGLARGLVVELREVCARLRPAILDDLGLVAALEWLLEEASKHSSARARLRVGNIEEEDRLRGELELALFRVTQEAVSNAVKHGNAQRIDVRLQRDNGDLRLRIDDDGVGFAAASEQTTGMGLPGMRERIRQVGGTVTIDSRSGRGTTIRVAVPIDELQRGTA